MSRCHDNVLRSVVRARGVWEHTFHQFNFNFGCRCLGVATQGGLGVRLSTDLPWEPTTESSTLGLHHTTWKSMACATVPALSAVNSWPGPGSLFSSTALQRRSLRSQVCDRRLFVAAAISS